MTYSEPQIFGELTFVFSSGEIQPPDGYYALAGVVPKNEPMTWVKETNPGSGALAKPTDWTDIWWASPDSDHAHQGWRLVAPAGYQTLSDVWEWPDDAPILEDRQWLGWVPWQHIRCVKETINDRRYTALGSKIYADKQEYFPCTVAPEVIPDSTGILLAPGACAWLWQEWSQAGLAPGDVYVLDLPVPAASEGDLAPPVLHSFEDVPQTQSQVTDRIVTVPCTAIIDKGQSPEWIVKNSPVYTVQRERLYDLVVSLYNQTDVEDEIGNDVTEGVTTTDSKAFHETVGMKVGFEVGIQAEGIGAKVSGEISKEMGYSQEHSVSVMQENSVHATAKAAPKKTTALYSETHTLRAYRMDGTQASQQNGLTFHAGKQYATCQYPPAASDQDLPEVTLRRVGSSQEDVG
ncbi:hypothetical protein T261_0791 [Streptomyces lydicus]|nr:hypothetical protein T261_0791 [Streptomyces lydicus]